MEGVAVKVGIVPEVRGLADSATAVPVDLGKAAILRAVWVVIAKVPFAEHAGLVAVVFEELADGDDKTMFERSLPLAIPRTRATEIRARFFIG